jgi:predicted CXXCH cytochrome family protein
MRRLNRILGTTAAIVALVGLPVVALAGISGTSHDLSGKAWNTSGEICIVCHTPHNAPGGAGAPLWNHEITAVTDYAVYTSGTLTATDADQPGPTSLLCLSCHDGTVAVDAFGGSAGGAQTISAGAAYVGQDLSDDHPIGFTYDATLVGLDPGLRDPTTTAANIPTRPGNINVRMLFGATNDQMECASCHDPHATQAGVTNFLRKSNATSALCLTCHDK